MLRQLIEQIVREMLGSDAKEVLATVRGLISGGKLRLGSGTGAIPASSLPTHDITAHTATGGAEGDVPTVQADGTLALQAPAGGPGSVDAADVTYTPTALADWTAAADPGNVDGALDQLAARTKTLEGVPAGTLPWFDVTAYGAAGDGTTDDTSAISDAITALNSAGHGVLYFPAGTYNTSGGFALSVPTLVLGDGQGSAEGAAAVRSEVRCTSTTASLFTVTAHGCGFRDIALVNTAVGTPSDGAGVTISTGDMARFDNVSIVGFYINLDVVSAAYWVASGCYFRQSHKYAIRSRNVALPDGGDQCISDCYIVDGANHSDAAIRIESGGGLKITNVKVNSNENGFLHGIDLAPASGVDTSQLLVSNCSIENVRGNAVNIANAAGGKWSQILLANSFLNITNGTGYAIRVNAAASADIRNLTVVGCTLRCWEPVSQAAVALTNVAGAYITGIIREGFAATLSQTGCTGVVYDDGTVGVSDHGALSGLEDDDHTQYVTEARHDALDHTGLPGVGAGGELMVRDGSSAPPVTLTNEAEDDWLYADA